MENLKKFRKEKGIKQEEIAAYLNVSRGSYSRYETGSRKMDQDTLKKISEFLNVSIDYLVGNIEYPITLDELKFAKEIDTLSDEEAFESYDFVIDGEAVTKEEAKKMLELIRTLKK